MSDARSGNSVRRLRHSRSRGKARLGEPGSPGMTHERTRGWRSLSAATVAAIALAACTARGSSPAAAPPGTSAGVDSQTAAPQPPVTASPVEDVPSGLAWATGGTAIGLPTPEVPLTELRSGGPPPDGIPPIDEPKFVPASAVDFIADSEPVLALEIGGESRAYPVQILLWHEIVNDVVAGVPVAVTYCPLCNSAVAYDRRVAGRVATFSTSGLLWNSALVMYDRQTETLWSHFTGRAIAGVLTGTELDTYPVATVPWSVWRDAHPTSLVLSRDTGFDRSYGSNPYPGYDDVTSQPFLFDGEVDGRLTAMSRVVGIIRAGDATAVPLTDLRERKVISLGRSGPPITIWWAAGTSSPLDASRVADGDDIGSTAVFSPVVGELSLTFHAGQGGFIDDQTGSTWNLLGTAIAGPMTGTQLDAVEHVDTFWFAWATFRPDTTLTHGGEE